MKKRKTLKYKNSSPLMGEVRRGWIKGEIFNCISPSPTPSHRGRGDFVLKIFGVSLSLLMLYAYGANANTAQDLKEEVLFVYDDHGKRDPLWPLVTPGGGIMSYETDFLISDLNLEGVVVGEGEQNLAIINGRIVKEKDQIGQFVVLQIKRDKVILLQDEQEFELRLK